MRPYVFGVAGWPGVGKTALIERLVPELRGRGFRIGILREAATPAETERAQVDLQRYQQAGAAATAVATPESVQHGLEDMNGTDHGAAGRTAVDVILAEGFRTAPWPKLEVFRRPGPLWAAGDPWLVALVGIERPTCLHLPWFRPEEIRRIVDAIENARPLSAIVV